MGTLAVSGPRRTPFLLAALGLLLLLPTCANTPTTLLVQQHVSAFSERYACASKCSGPP